MSVQEYLEILRCPHCAAEGKGELSEVKKHWLGCGDCGRQYPINEGIPVMLPEEGDKWMQVPVEVLPDIS